MDEQAREKASALMALVSDLLRLSDDILTKRFLFDPNDPFDLMLVTYFSKQVDHLNSIQLLIRAGKDGDATIIARVMSEGLVQLLWSASDRPARPHLWYWYAAVMDWRQLRENRASGLDVDPADVELLEEKLSEHGPAYYSPKTLERLRDGKALPDDPYRRRWHPGDARSMFNEVRGELWYEMIYEPSSERIHWNPRSILRSLDFVDGLPLGYRIGDPRDALNALVTGFAALLQTLEVVDQFLDLGVTETVEGLRDRFES